MKILNNEKGGADQLIIVFMLIVIGIGIAILFGEDIKRIVTNLFIKIS